MFFLRRRCVSTWLSVPLVFFSGFAMRAASAEARSAEHKIDDPILRAMQAELDREKSALVLPGMQHPYFIEYRLDDLTSYEAIANYGALTTEQENHQRIVRVTVRVGSYVHDNSSTRGDGVAQLAPTDDNAQAIRYALWLATDDAYKVALRNLAAKEANLKRFEQQSHEHDFAEATPVTHIEPLRSLDIDRAEWRRRLATASGLYASEPEVRDFAAQIQYSTANVRAIAVNRYLVNTEGSVVRNGYSGYQDGISVGGQAADGMRLGRDNGTVATTSKELESAEDLRRRAISDLKSFHELSLAPVVDADDYHGPVLFSADAASDILTRLFDPNIEADRPEAGTTARTQGAYTSSLRARVLPTFLNMTDNPRLTTFAGQQLLGAYEVDDEAVPAQAVDVVVGGKLENYLIGREPVRDFATSNGHGRAAPAQAPHPHAGVAVFTANEKLSDQDMTNRLLAMGKEQKRDVYAVETLGGELVPRLLYRVHPDGSRQLVRGAAFDELDNRSLRSSIVAAGGTPWVYNLLGPIPQTTIAPALLFEDIVVKRANEEQQKLPYYPPPPLGK